MGATVSIFFIGFIILISLILAIPGSIGIIACRNGNSSIARLLIKNGANSLGILDKQGGLSVLKKSN